MVTYSFADTSVVISHPAVGAYTASGTGIGSIAVQMSNDRTAHDIAADGAVMVSKIKARNGLMAISAQQTSDLNNWLTKWYNYLETAPSSEYEKTTITIKSQSMGDNIVATRVSPQKLPDKPYQAQGQQITWNLMAADIQQN